MVEIPKFQQIKERIKDKETLLHTIALANKNEDKAVVVANNFLAGVKFGKESNTKQ